MAAHPGTSVLQHHRSSGCAARKNEVRLKHDEFLRGSLVRANEMPASRQYDPENIDNRGRQPLLTKLEPMTLA